MPALRPLLIAIFAVSNVLAADKTELDRQYETAMRMDVRVITAALKAQLRQQFAGAAVFSQERQATFLGNVENRYAMDSIFNDVGMHGSSVAMESIWNDVGTYGSTVGMYSARNPVCTQPPVLVKNRQVIGVLTVNTTQPGAIDPILLRWAWND